MSKKLLASLRKTIASFLMVAMIVALSGLGALIPTTQAATIVDGDVVRNPSAAGDAQFDVYIVKLVGAKKFKRLVLNPQVFESYGHLKWENIKTVTTAEMNSYTTSAIVRVETDPKVLALAPNGDTGSKSWLNVTAGDFVAVGGDWDSVYVINAVDAANYAVASDLTTQTQVQTFLTTGVLPGGVVPTPTPTPTSTPVAGALSIGLAADTPVAGYVSKNVQNAVFAKFNFTAAGATNVSKIVLQRKGLGYDADLSTIRLYDGATQIGTDQSLNTTTHKVTFTNLNWSLAGGATKALIVKANIASSPSGTNDYLELAEVVSDATSTTGLPVAGNTMQFSALSAGELDVVAVSGTATVISGETNVELGCWNLTTSSLEGFYVDSIKVTNTGSASSTDASTFSLKVSGAELPGSTVAAMASNGTITFDLTANPYFINKSTVKKICVYGNITSGITVAKTLILQIADTKDVAARGDSSAGEVLITITGNLTFTSQTAKTNNIAQGSATLAQDGAYVPTSGTTLVKGVPNNKMAAYKLSAGSNEGVKLTKLAVILAGTNVANTDFTNWKIFKVVSGAEVEIPVSGSVSGLNVTFEDTTDGLIDVAKSENGTIIIRADISTSAAGDESGAKIYVGADGTTNTLARIKGLASGEYITSGVTLSSVATGNAQTFSIGANGDLTVSKAATSPASTTMAKGSTRNHFTTINLYATGEDISVSELTLTAYETADQTNVADAGEISNVYITDETGNQLGSTVSAPSSGVSSFSFSYTVPKETNKAIKVYADVPSGSTADYLHVDMTTANTDITSTGASSAATITETGTAQGSTMTVGGPTIVAAMATSPIASSYVQNSTGIVLGKLVLTAGTSENVKVTSIKIKAGINTDDLDTASAANTSFANVRLVDASSPATQYGSTLNLTDGTPDYISFTGISNLTVAKGGAKTLNVIADIKGSSLVYEFGVKNPATDITGTGVSSNTSATVTPSGSSIASQAATLTTVGTLKVNKAADMPSAAQLVSGTTGVELMKYKFEASYEDITVTILPIYYTGTVADIANVKIYVDGTQKGNLDGYVLTAGLNTITLDPGVFVIPKSGSAVLSMKADINPKAQVTTSVSSVYIGLADSAYTAVTGANADSEWGGAGNYNITAAGVASGTAITKANIGSTGAAGGSVYGSNAFTVHKGILTVTLTSGSPSSTATAGSNKPLMYVDLAATGDDITIDGLEFCYGGVASATTPGGDITLKSSDSNTTYGTITATEFDQYWDDIGGDATNAGSFIPLKTGVAGTVSTANQGNCFSFGRTGFTGASIYNQTTHNASSTGALMDAFANTISISAGSIATVKLYGDTTGLTTNSSLQITLTPNGTSAYKASTSGVKYEDSSTTVVDLATTKNLPLSGGSLIY